MPLFGDESAVQHRLAERGYRVLYAGDVRVEHVVGAERLRLRELWRRELYRGASAAIDGRVSPVAGTASATKAAAGLAVALVTRRAPLAGERFARLARGSGAAAAPLLLLAAAPPGMAAAVNGRLLIVSLGTTDGWVVNEEELTAGAAAARDRSRRRPAPSRTGAAPAADRNLGRCRHDRGGGSPARPAGRSARRQALGSDRPQHHRFAVVPVRRLRAAGIQVAIRIDCPSSASQPGSQNAGQRALERRRLREATLAGRPGPRSAALLSALAPRVAILPVPVEIAADGRPSSVGAGGDVVTYAADPDNKGLDLVCRAWWALGSRPTSGACSRSPGVSRRARPPAARPRRASPSRRACAGTGR